MIFCYLLFQLWAWLLWYSFRLTRQTFWSRRTRHAPCAPTTRFRPVPPRRSGGSPKPPWVCDVVLRLYAEGKIYRNVMHEFKRLHAHQGVSVCLNTIYAWVQKYSAEWQTIRRATRNRLPLHATANLRWCLDGTGKGDDHGNMHFILGIIDYGTRACLTLERLSQPDTKAILAALFRAVAQFGMPRIIRTDNASMFCSESFCLALATAGIRHEFIEPGKPRQNVG